MSILRHKAYEALRRSERFFKTDMIYAAKGGFWLSWGQISAATISFLLSIAFANLITQESYGIYKYILSIAAIFGVFTLSGMGSAIARAVAKGAEGEFIKGIKINLKWETLILIGGVTGSVYYYLNGNHSLALGLLIIGLFSPVKDSVELYPSILIGRKDFKTLGLLSFWRTALSAVWMFLTILLYKNPIIIVLSYFFIHTTITSLFLLWILKTKKLNDKTDDETTKLAWHSSLINNVAGFVEQIDNVLVFHYLGAASLAVYNFAQAIPEYLAAFSKNIGVLAMPKFTQGDKKKIKATLFQKSLKIVIFGAVLAILYVILAPIFFSLFFPKYTDSIRYSQVYALILLTPAVLPLAYLDSQLAIKEKYRATLLSSIFKLSAILIGLYYFGIWGLIIARIVSKIFGSSLAFHYAFKV